MSVELIAFLRARLAEDEAVAKAAKDVAAKRTHYRASLIATADRELRDVDAKRRLIRVVCAYEAKIDGEWGCGCSADAIEAGRCPETDVDDIEALRLLALPYADHDDYQEAWRVPRGD